MTVMELSKIQIALSPQIAMIAKANIEVNGYLKLCLDLFFSGMFGEMSEKTLLENQEALDKGAGTVLAKYPALDGLADSVVVIAEFDKDKPGIQTNHIIIAYDSERKQEGG